MSISREEANKQLSEKLEEVKKLISECEDIADEHGLTFSSPISHYGMGGDFTGKGPADENGEWENSSTGWQSSSERC